MSTRFFIASGCGIATTTRYRCIHLQEQLQQLGFAAEVAEWFDDSKVDPVRPLDFDVLILYRLAFSPRLDRLISEARRLRKIVLFDTDDLIFEPELIGAHRGVKNLTSEDQVRHADGVRRYLATLEACDAAITATPLLAQLATTHGKRAFVHRNALGREMLALADELYAARGQRAAGEQIVLGYGSGTPTHDVDFLEAAGALARVLSRFPQVELWIVGPLKLSAALERREGARVHLFPATGWAEWFGVASQMDIAIAPLERDNIFCRAKSEVKFIEAAALGVPLVASRIDPYLDSITDGIDGLLAVNESEWENALALLIEEPDRRAAIGGAARRRALQRYTPEARTAELAAILRQLGVSIPGSPRKVEATRRLIINWLVPEPFPGAGGDTGIFRMIRYLAEFGHECRVYVVSYNLMNGFDTGQVRAYVRKHFGGTDAVYYKWNGVLEDADATFATFWPTAEILQALPNGGQRYYLVQDFEPAFYPGDEHHTQRAENTYRTDFHCITLGPWLAKLLRERYSATADHFDFAIETGTYWPRRDLRVPNRVCFYARPNTPRRAYEMGVAALELVKTRRPESEIVLFGADELTPPPRFPVTARGMLAAEELATLFSSCDVGVVLSLTNPSFVSLEMMACRCAVVELASERLDGVLTHGQDAWLVEANAEAIAAGIILLLEHDALREKLIETAYRRARAMDWRDSARQIEAVLLRQSATNTAPVATARK